MVVDLNKYYCKTVTSTLIGNSEYEEKIKELIKENVSMFITSANDGFRVLKHTNKLPKELRVCYSSFTGTTTGILVEFYLAKYLGEVYRNDKVDCSCQESSHIFDSNKDRQLKWVDSIYTEEWLCRAYNEINSTDIEDIEKLIELAMDFAALESYYRCGKEQCFDVVKCRYKSNEKDNVYEIIKKDAVELYKAFKKTIIKEQILTCNDDVIINPIFSIIDYKSENLLLKGDGDFIINRVLYDLKCLTNSNYESENGLQLMFYYILNELNKYHDISVTCKNGRAGLDIEELKVFNPRYEAVMKFEIRLQLDLLELGKKILELIKLNSELYYNIFNDTILEFSNNNVFLKLSKNDKVREIDKFYKANSKYRFIINNGDYYDFLQRIIYKIGE